MADLSPYYAALQKADAAGDTAGAKQLADYIRSQASANSSTQSTQAVTPSYWDRVNQTGDAVDQAAGPGLAGYGRAAVGAGENALSMGSGMLGDIAGAATSMLTQNPQRGASVRNALTYQPRTDTGKAGQQYVGALTAPIGSLFNAPVQALDNSGHPILAQAARAGEDLAPFAAPKALSAASRLIPTAAPALAPEVASATNAGLRLTPQQAGGPLGQTLQSLTGSAKLERSISLKNAPQVNKLAAQEIGTPDLSDASIAKAKAPANAVYKQVASVGKVPLDQQFKTDIASISNPGAGSFSFDTPAAITNLKSGYGALNSFDAGDAVAKVRQLRADAAQNIKAPMQPEQNALGYAQQKVSQAIENQLDRHIQANSGTNGLPPDLVDQYRAARVQLAKIHSVEDAMDGPNISAKDLAKQLNRGVPLSGNLRTIADAHNNFDRSFQAPSGIRDSGPFGALDTSILGLSAFSKPALALATLAKPVVRSALASKPYQAFGIRNAPILSAAISGLLGAGGRINPAVPLSLMGPQQQGLLQ